MRMSGLSPCTQCTDLDWNNALQTRTTVVVQAAFRHVLCTCQESEMPFSACLVLLSRGDLGDDCDQLLLGKELELRGREHDIAALEVASAHAALAWLR